jgi:1,4-dihydroxy-2-naphthoate octaprenyltransferase
MGTSPARSLTGVWLEELRAKFFTASAMPVLIGAAAAYATSGTFRPGIFAATLLGMLLLHAGANVLNDYFDHASGADWVKGKENPLAGGSQVIQRGLLSPRAVLVGGLVFLAAGAAVGLALAWTTHSVFILVLALLGLFGGYFYTAPPLRIGYTPLGLVVTGLCFGPLPVFGTYFLQTGRVDAAPLVPGLIAGFLIFLVLLVNGFPDAASDRPTHKRTLAVVLGTRAAAWVFQVTLVASYPLAIAGMLLWPRTLSAAVGYLLTIPLAVLLLGYFRREVLGGARGYRANRAMLLLQLTGSMMLALGFVLSGWMR